VKDAYLSPLFDLLNQKTDLDENHWNVSAVKLIAESIPREPEKESDLIDSIGEAIEKSKNVIFSEDEFVSIKASALSILKSK
jgi:hypothetical protein